MNKMIMLPQMKPETEQRLNKLIQLLVHVMEGGSLNYKGSIASNPDWANVMRSPEAYSIHIEPMVVYVPEYASGDAYCPSWPYLTEEAARKSMSPHCLGIRRFVEDLDWKPTPTKLIT